MKKQADKSNGTQTASDDDLREKYDFASMQGGERGKYHKQGKSGTNVEAPAP